MKCHSAALKKKKKKRARKRRRTGSNLIPLGGNAVLCWCVEVSSSSKQHTAAIIPELHAMRHSFSGRSTTFTSRKKQNQGCQLLTCAADAERVKHGAILPTPPSTIADTHSVHLCLCWFVYWLVHTSVYIYMHEACTRKHTLTNTECCLVSRRSRLNGSFIGWSSQVTTLNG